MRTMAGVPGSVVLDAGGVAIAESIPCGRALRMPAGPWDKLPSIDVSCPAAKLNVFGFAVIWPAWFLVVALFDHAGAPQASGRCLLKKAPVAAQ